MAKKHFGKLLTLAAIVGAAAAGVSYVLQYKSFHKELDEDFHDFEDDFDDFDDAGDKEASKASDTSCLRTQLCFLKSGKEAPAETPEKLLNILEESEKAPADADVSSEEPDQNRNRPRRCSVSRTANLLPRKKIPTQPRMTAQP
ncbi:MAG: hypothetical protein ACLR8P_02395 [Clostridium fessum]